MKKVYKWLIIFTGLFLIVELILRLGFGFCDTVLMQSDPDFEYIAQPNQDRHRFGNDIEYNSLSMRNEEVDPQAIHILGLGDSVLNGGVLTDQDSLATFIVAKKLTNKLHKKVQFLNISAGSWGPDNCYAYIKRYGDFNAKVIYLLVSSHDAHDDMNFSDVVGKHPSYPDRQYTLAVVELFDRYLYPRILKIFKKKNEQEEDEAVSLGINKNGKEFNTGFKDIVDFAKKRNIPLKILLHPEKHEFKMQDYNAQGKEIIEFCQKNNIELIKLIDKGYKTNFYRDGIHLNENGQKLLSDVIFKDLNKSFYR
ncbi:MAG: hypothetical protein V7767_15380 [Leeuwenhoekiella sp.]